MVVDPPKAIYKGIAFKPPYGAESVMIWYWAAREKVSKTDQVGIREMNESKPMKMCRESGTSCQNRDIMRDCPGQSIERDLV